MGLQGRDRVGCQPEPAELVGACRHQRHLLRVGVGRHTQLRRTLIAPARGCTLQLGHQRFELRRWQTQEVEQPLECAQRGRRHPTRLEQGEEIQPPLQIGDVA